MDNQDEEALLTVDLFPFSATNHQCSNRTAPSQVDLASNKNEAAHELEIQLCDT